MFQSASTTSLSPGHNTSPPSIDQASKEKRRGSLNPHHLASISESPGPCDEDTVDGGAKVEKNSLSMEQGDGSGEPDPAKDNEDVEEATKAAEVVITESSPMVVVKHEGQERAFLTALAGASANSDQPPVKPPRKKKSLGQLIPTSQTADGLPRLPSPQRSLSSPTGFTEGEDIAAQLDIATEYEQYQKSQVSRTASDTQEYLNRKEKTSSDENLSIGLDRKKRKGSLFQIFSKKKEEKPDALSPNEESNGIGKFKFENDAKTFSRSTSNTSISSSGASMEGLNEVDGNASAAQNEAAHKKEGFVRKMSRKMRHVVVGKKWEETVEEVLLANNKKLGHKFHMIDLSMEDVPDNPPSKKINYATYCQMGMCASCVLLLLH